MIHRGGAGLEPARADKIITLQYVFTTAASHRAIMPNSVYNMYIKFKNIVSLISYRITIQIFE